MKKTFLLLSFLVLCLSHVTIKGSENTVNQKNNISTLIAYPFKKAWEHKKKVILFSTIIGLTIASGLQSREFDALYDQFNKMSDKEQCSKEIADRLASLATG